jgi:LysM repeat protein
VLTSTAKTPQRYVVQQGDTLFSLARRYGTTVEDIQQANKLANDSIYVGQQLIMPTP